MSTRPDISDNLIHFTKGNTKDEAFENLYNIIQTRKIYASNNKIKGSYKVVCFTEAPLFKNGLVNPNNYSQYSPFGIMFTKKWIFQEGGRPVFYQPDKEFQTLPDEIKWRHVRYEPDIESPIDFSWEREWRIKRDALNINPAYAFIVVPNKNWAQRLKDCYHHEQDMIVRQYSIIDELIAEMAREQFQWQIRFLDQDEEER